MENTTEATSAEQTTPAPIAPNTGGEIATPAESTLDSLARRLKAEVARHQESIPAVDNATKVLTKANAEFAKMLADCRAAGERMVAEAHAAHTAALAEQAGAAAAVANVKEEIHAHMLSGE